MNNYLLRYHGNVLGCLVRTTDNMFLFSVYLHKIYVLLKASLLLE